MKHVLHVMLTTAGSRTARSHHLNRLNSATLPAPLCDGKLKRTQIFYCSVFLMSQPSCSPKSLIIFIALSLVSCAFFSFHMPPKITALELLALDSVGIQKKLKAGSLTSVELVNECLRHIDKHDQRGARLNAMISIVPKHILSERSQQLDRERAAGHVRGPFHGIPILVKVIREHFDGDGTSNEA